MIREQLRDVFPKFSEPDPKKGLQAGDIACLVMVMFLWALCFPLITVGLRMAPPLTMAALRSFLAGVGILLPAVVLGRPWPRGWRVWVGLLGVGLSLTALGFGGMFLAGGLVSPGVATVLANIQPLLAAVLAFFLLGERLGRRRRTGLILGFAGILLVAAPGFGPGFANNSPAGVAFILLGAVGVAIGNVLLKRLAGEVDMLMATGWQLLIGGIPLWFLAGIWEAPAQITWNLAFVTTLSALALLGTAVPFVLWFSILHRSELNRVNIFTFLTPAIVLVLGILFFNETLTWIEMSGTVLILSGVVWISRQQSVVRPARPSRASVGLDTQRSCPCCSP